MQNKPLISILVPTYNRLKYLKECLDSIIIQKGFLKSELELIVSDNSEGDESKKFMDKYIKDHNDWNIYYNKNKINLGMVGNWNKLLELKKGDYFIFLSDDDKFYDENSLNILYQGLIKNKHLKVSYGIRLTIDGNGKIATPNYELIPRKGESLLLPKRKLFIGNAVGFGGILFTSQKKISFDENAGPAADWDFNLYYLINIGPFCYIMENTFLYREHENNIGKSVSFYESRKYVTKKYGLLPLFLLRPIYLFLNQNIKKILNLLKI